MTRPLGSEQLGLLRTIAGCHPHKEWSSRAGWHWGGFGKTSRLCETLANRGLLDRLHASDDYGRYRLNEAGLAAAAQKEKPS